MTSPVCFMLLCSVTSAHTGDHTDLLSLFLNTLFHFFPATVCQRHPASLTVALQPYLTSSCVSPPALFLEVAEAALGLPSTTQSQHVDLHTKTVGTCMGIAGPHWGHSLGRLCLCMRVPFPSTSTVRLPICAGLHRLSVMLSAFRVGALYMFHVTSSYILYLLMFITNTTVSKYSFISFGTSKQKHN